MPKARAQPDISQHMPPALVRKLRPAMLSKASAREGERNDAKKRGERSEVLAFGVECREWSDGVGGSRSSRNERNDKRRRPRRGNMAG